MVPPLTVVGLEYPRDWTDEDALLAASLGDTLEGLWYLMLCHQALHLPGAFERIHKRQSGGAESAWIVALRRALFANSARDTMRPFAELPAGESVATLAHLKIMAASSTSMAVIRDGSLVYRRAIEGLILTVHRRWRIQAALAPRVSNRRFLYCDALLRSCLYAVSLPGIAMALIPLALLCHETLHKFCLESGIDHSQLHRIESGTTSISLPRLRRIVETLPTSRMQEAFHIAFATELEFHKKLFAWPFNATNQNQVRPDDALGSGSSLADLSQEWWRSLDAPNLKFDRKGRIDVDHFRDGLLELHRSGVLSYSVSAQLIPCDRSYLSRTLRGESAGSVELFIAMAWVFGQGRLIIEAEKRRPSAEVGETLALVSRPRPKQNATGELNGTE